MKIQHICLLLTLGIAMIACKGKDSKTITDNTEKDVYMFTSFHEPATDGLRFLYSYDGYVWDSIPGIFLIPEVGVQKVMRDPSIVQGSDGVFHLVWTTSWRGDLGFGYSSSKDLINWTPQKHIPIMAFDTTTVNVWAPELFYDEDNNDFVIVWSSTIPYKFDKGEEDEFNNHRLYYSRTNDFVSFTDPQLLYDPGYSSIDAVIVKKAPQEYVLVLKDNTRSNRNIKVAFGNSPIGPFNNVSAPFTEKFTEGPSVVKVGDDWLVYFDSYEKSTYNAVATTDFENFRDVSDSISVPRGHKHGSIFKAKESVLKTILKESVL